MQIKTLSLVVVAFSLVASCKDDEQKTSFVSNCAGSQEPFTDEICSCIYDSVKDDFSEDQVSRISGLFHGNVPEAMSDLGESGNDSDIDILERMDSVEGAAEYCFEQAG